MLRPNWLVTLLGLAIGCGGEVERDRIFDVSGGSGGIGGSNGGAAGSGGGGASGGTGGSVACSGDLASNPDHCGYCGHSCLGGSCTDGACQPVVLKELGNLGATALAVDDAHVWWAEPLQRMTKSGSDWLTLSETEGDVWGVAVDATHVYWTGIFDAGLYRIAKSGGTKQLLAPAGYRVAVDDTHVYTAWDGVWKVPKNGGAPTMLAPNGGQGIALDATHVYFTTWSPGGVHKVAKNGGPVVDLASSPASSYAAVWGDRVYWSSQGENLVLSVSTGGGATQVVFESATPYGIAADAAGVYWAEFSGGSIWMLPTGETLPIRLAGGQFSPRDLAVDEQAVYWTNDASYSAVSKVAKP